MITQQKTYDELIQENDQLRKRLEEAEATVEAIRGGEIDAVVVQGTPSEQIYTLEGADRPYRLLVEAMEQAVATVTQDGIILYCNPCFGQLVNRPHDQVMGTAVASFLVAADRPLLAAMLAQATTAAPCELRLQRGGADSVPVVLQLGPLPFRGALCLLVTDLTQQKQYEELKQTEERLRLLFEAAAALLTANNPDVMVRELFARISSHLGLDAYFNYLVADSGDYLRLASYVGVSAEAARGLERLEFGQAVCGTAVQQCQPIQVSQLQHSDDERVRLLKAIGFRAYVCNPLLAGGRLLGTLSFASRTREQLGAVELAFLEAICYYATVAYERLRLLNQLRDADRRKDEFLASLAHELRNPLGPIRNAVQVLRLNGPDAPEQSWGLEIIDRQATHLSRLIDDLLDISRITRNKLELRREHIELGEVLRGAVETTRPAIAHSGHELTVTLPTEPIYLHADPVRLAQVFVNLLDNAAKYTPHGGHIWLTAERQGGEIVARVKDTGIGLPVEKLPQLFEMFFQVDRTLERAQGGLGIGLSLVRRLVELHGGSVQAQSKGPGQGSEFIVRLPILEQEQAPPPQRAGTVAATAALRRILVVDDNPDAAGSLSQLLRMIGNEVQTAHDGLEAIAAAERFRPEVVLLDIGMPRLNGYDAAQRMRAAPWGQSMVLVALTGWGQEEDKRRAQVAGFDAHLVKPVDPTALTSLLNRLYQTAPVSGQAHTDASG
jgi:signal transduction histidine kinase/ActR/RegA family two-component response regulator